MYFGELVKQERKAAKLTQQELADKVNVSKMTIRRIEAIKTDKELQSINLKTLIAISEVLKSYDIWSMSVGRYSIREIDPDLGLVYLSANILQREYGFSNEQIRLKMELDYAFVELTEEGQQKAVEYVVDLSGNPKYINSSNTNSDEQED